ncbi:MAG: PKD domain-containing protein [Bdellovibrionota bacterium]
MKKIILLALSLFLINDAFAAARVSNHQVKALIAKMQKAKSQRATKISKLSEPLIRTWMTPGTQPKQGEAISFFAQPNSNFENSEVFIEAALDGNSLPLLHPVDTLWIADAGVVTEIKSHDFVATLFIQDKSEAQQYRDSISSLEAQIADLNSQIAAASDPTVIAQLTAQRDEKAGLKDQLVAALAALKTPVGSETIHFSVIGQDQGAIYPWISDVSPHVAVASGGTTLTISGVNFGSSPQVILGGIPTAVTSSTSTSIFVQTPVFTEEGEKDVEIRFIEGAITKNAIRKNAFFATNDIAIPPTAPVAVAEAVASPVAVGSPAQVTGVHSFDINSQPLDFQWRLISKPTASTLSLNSPGNPGGTAVTYAVMPDAPGNYVFELRVNKTTNPSSVGEISLAFVEATAPANRAPSGTAPAITVGKNFSKTSQIAVTDPDFWQQRSFIVMKQGSLGSASVSSSGLVTYAAGSTIGSDSVDILIVDNGNPPLSSVVSIPATVVDNFPPVFNAPILARQKTQGKPYQARLSENIGVNGVTDPDGTIQSVVWNFGDGTSEATLDRNSNFIFHNYMQTGTYTVTVTATDNLGASTSQSTSLLISDTDIPTAKFRASPLSGTFPLTVNFDGSESSDADGIVAYRWFFSGAPSEEVTTVPTKSHTYSAPGTYSVRLRTVDGNGAEGETTVPVTLGTSSGSAPPQALHLDIPRMATLGNAINFSGTRSFTPTVGASLTNYNWSMNDFSACPSNGCSVNAFSQDWTYSSQNTNFVGLQVTSSLGALSARTFQEIIVTDGGAPPRAVARAATFNGVAPFTLNLNMNESYVYSGGAPIASYRIFWGDGSVSNSTSSTISHTYNTAFPFGLSAQAIDSNGNIGTFTQNVLVTSSLEELKEAKKLDEAPADPEREYQRQMLTGACGVGDGSACYELGKMYGEDGNEFAKQKLWEKACNLGYAQACTR